MKRILFLTLIGTLIGFFLGFTPYMLGNGDVNGHYIQSTCESFNTEGICWISGEIILVPKIDMALHYGFLLAFIFGFLSCFAMAYTTRRTYTPR